MLGYALCANRHREQTDTALGQTLYRDRQCWWGTVLVGGSCVCTLPIHVRWFFCFSELNFLPRAIVSGEHSTGAMRWQLL